MRNPRGRPFQEGNKVGRGRPRGSRNKATMAVQALLGEHAEALTRKCIRMAMQGDAAAMRLCMERIAPPSKGTLVSLKLPTVRTAEEVGEAMNTVVQAVAKGCITPEDGQRMAVLLDSTRRTIETVNPPETATSRREAEMLVERIQRGRERVRLFRDAQACQPPSEKTT